MLRSTLSDLPGQRYRVLGMVAVDAVVGNSATQFDLSTIFQDLEKQAQEFGGNAMVDVKILRINRRHIIVTGTVIYSQEYEPGSEKEE